MTRTCGTCERTWDGSATFCGWCGDLLDTSLGRRRLPRPRPSWLHPGVLAAVAIGFVAGVLAAVPTLSIATDRDVDGQIGLPDDPEEVPADTTSALPPRPITPQASTSFVTCVVPTECVAWHRQVGGNDPQQGFSSPPIVAGDTVLVFDRNAVAAYDIRDGQRRWHRSYGTEAVDVRLLGWEQDRALLRTDVLSTSLVDLATGDTLWDVADGRELYGDIFVGDLVLTSGSSPSGSAAVRALDVASGDLVWEWESPWPVAHVSETDAETIVAHSQEGSQAELDPATGTARSVTFPAREAPEPQESSVIAVRDDLAVVMHWDAEPARGGFAAEPEPRIEVTHLPSGQARWTQRTTGDFPTAVLDNVVIFSTRLEGQAARELQARDLATGDVTWTLELKATTNVGLHPEEPSVRQRGSQSVMVAESGTVWRLDPTTGETLWETDLSHGNSDWVTIDRGFVVVQAGPTVTLLDLDTGEELLVADLRGGWLIDVDPPVVYDGGLGTLTVLRLP